MQLGLPLASKDISLRQAAGRLGVTLLGAWGGHRGAAKGSP
jgi:hypothetical protein